MSEIAETFLVLLEDFRVRVVLGGGKVHSFGSEERGNILLGISIDGIIDNVDLALDNLGKSSVSREVPK